MSQQPSRPLSLRERQKAQTREHLLDVAARLVAERGYDGTTMDDIARAAGSSRATVYTYFATKDDILRTLAVEMWERTEELYQRFAALPEWTRAAIRGWVGAVATAWDETSDRTRVVVESYRRELDQHWLDYHRGYVRTLMADEAQWRRFSRPEAEVRALLLISQMEVFFGTWFIRGWKLGRSTALDTLADVWCSTLKVEE